MRRTRRSPLWLAGALAALAALPAGQAAAQTDSSWVLTEGRARAALAARDTLAFRNELLKLCDQLNGNPRVVLRLARAEASLGHRGSACQWLGRYAEMGLGLDLASDSLLNAMTSDSACTHTRERLDRNLRDPVDQAGVVFTLPDHDVIAEDLAYDAKRHRFFVSSVRTGRVMCFDRHGHTVHFGLRSSEPLWSTMALGVDVTRGRLWVTTACLHEGLRWTASDSGRTAVLCFDLDNGRRLGRWEPPRDGHERALGDMTLGPDGTAYISESIRGAVYRIRGLTDSLETLVPEGTLRSPQTPALTPDRDRLMVADYSLGIAIIDLATQQVSWLGHRRNVALTGIDGLYFAGDALIAVQNGTQPERLIKLTLDPRLTTVASSQVLQQNTRGLGDPTHGVMVAGDFHFIANSGWDRVDESNPSAPMSPGAAPKIMKLHIHQGP